MGEERRFNEGTLKDNFKKVCVDIILNTSEPFVRVMKSMKILYIGQ